MRYCRVYEGVEESGDEEGGGADVGREGAEVLEERALGGGCRSYDKSEYAVSFEVFSVHSIYRNGCQAYFVRIRSKGASARPAIAAAPMATPRDAHGYADSPKSMAVLNPAIMPGSGTFKSADSTPRAQLSKVFNKIP